MLLRLSERVPIYSLKVDIIFPIKGCNQRQKHACDYTDIAMDEVDKFLVDFSFNDLELDIYGRYRVLLFLGYMV